MLDEVCSSAKQSDSYVDHANIRTTTLDLFNFVHLHYSSYGMG